MIEDVFEKTEAYVKTNVELFKLQAAGKLAVVLASLVTRIIVIIFVLLFFLMVNIGLAVWLGDALGQMYYGFFIVAGLYALFAIFASGGRPACRRADFSCRGRGGRRAYSRTALAAGLSTKALCFGLVSSPVAAKGSRRRSGRLQAFAGRTGLSGAFADIWRR